MARPSAPPPHRHAQDRDQAKSAASGQPSARWLAFQANAQDLTFRQLPAPYA